MLAAILAWAFAGLPAAAQDDPNPPVVHTTAVEPPTALPSEPIAPEPEDDERPLDEERGAGEPGPRTGIVIAAAATLDGAPSTAPSRPRIEWDPSWPHYHLDELVLTAGMILVVALGELLPTRTDANWAGANDFDTTVQNGLGLDQPGERTATALVSDVLVGALLAWPLLLDSLLYAGVGEGAWDVAWQLSLISLEVFAVNHALNITLKLISRRERPLGVFCRERPGYNGDATCGDPPPAESFWSGHVSTAFAGAALVCVHHDALNLFGDEGTDGAACGTALAMAAATGLFRIMSDRHWITDVLAGAAIGSLVGTLLPWLLHYRGGARPALRSASAPPIALAPMVDENTLGLTAFGLW